MKEMTLGNAFTLVNSIHNYLLLFHYYRKLQADQFTSLILNFDAESVNNIEVFVPKDTLGAHAKKRNRIKESLGLETYDEEEKVPPKEMRKRGRPKKDRLFEGSARSASSASSQSASMPNTPASQQPATTNELVAFDYNDEMLFIGLIDSTKDNTSYNQLMVNMRTSNKKYQSDFWKEYTAEPEVPVKQVRPKTSEEVKETLALIEEAKDVLNHKQYTGTVFYRPRKDRSKIFIDNIEQISGLLFIQKQSIEEVANYYKMSKADMKE